MATLKLKVIELRGDVIGPNTNPFSTGLNMTDLYVKKNIIIEGVKYYRDTDDTVYGDKKSISEMSLIEYDFIHQTLRKGDRVYTFKFLNNVGSISKRSWFIIDPSFIYMRDYEVHILAYQIPSKDLRKYFTARKIQPV